MSGTDSMYELEYPSPTVTHDGADSTTLIVALQGYADAGHAVEGLSSHLVAALDSRVLATFSNDELIDYRSRRPAVTLAHHEVVSMEELQLDMRVLRDSYGKPFLLLSGPEPDLRWDAFSKAVADLVERFEIEQTLCVYAAPMAVPHTRPLIVSAHGNHPSLLASKYTFDETVTLPGAAALSIERELHRRGKKVAGLTAHVPHYVAASPYPHAAFQLLQAIEDTAHLSFPLLALEQDISRVNKQLADQTAASQEIATVVDALQQHYDKEMAEYRQRNPEAMMPGEAQVPSGEEISEAFENYLLAIEDRDRNKHVHGQRELPFGINEDGKQGAQEQFFYLDPDTDDDESSED